MLKISVDFAFKSSRESVGVIITLIVFFKSGVPNTAFNFFNLKHVSIRKSFMKKKSYIRMKLNET